MTLSSGANSASNLQRAAQGETDVCSLFFLGGGPNDIDHKIAK